MQSSIALIGLTLTPVLITVLGSAVGWRWGFALAALPGLVMAAVLWRFLREPSSRVTAGHQGRVSLWAAFRYRNVLLSIINGLLLGTWVACFNAFLPLWLTGQGYGMQLTAMGALLGVAGLATFAGMLLLPFLSDRVGRKPVVLAGSLILAAAAWTPVLGIAFLPMAVAFVLFNMGQATIPIVVAVIPSETAPRAILATAIALPVFALEAVGAFFSPIIAGGLADATHNPALPLVIAGAAAFLVALISLAYRESAPAKLAAAMRPQAAQARV